MAGYKTLGGMLRQLPLLMAATASGGCAMLNGFLDPTSVGPNAVFSREGTLDIRTSLSLQDTPTGGMTASEPLPEDLVPIVQDYAYQIGDVFNVRMFQLLGRNTETAAQLTIDEGGNVVIPAVGMLHVVGLTRGEIEAELVDAIVRKGIINEPEVIVEPIARRKLNYTVYGTVSQPNVYPLAQYDLKLLQAINIAGGFLDSVSEIFITRDPEAVKPVLASRTPSRSPARVTAERAALSMSDGFGASFRAQPPDEADDPPLETAPVEAPPVEDPAPADSDARQEIIETMVGDPPAREATAPDSGGPPPTAPSPSQPRWIWYNDRWVETQPAGEPAERPARSAEAAAPPAAEPETRPTIDWEQVAGEQKQRVIKISADALRNGDPRHNVIVRAGDTIRLASGEFGEYYLTGQVTRPGAYSLTGRNITLKAAISAAGDFAPLAWPSNCTIFRRYGDREEMRQVNLDAIFAGREQDLFVKKDDLILVGTSPVSPFLAVLRNAFRASYGFGFVYDRNFADVDAYNARFNPENEVRRFPNLFPDNNP